MSSAAVVIGALRVQMYGYISNLELNDERKLICFCLRKSEVSVERIPVRYVIENLAEHGIHCLPCFYTSDIINMLPLQL